MTASAAAIKTWLKIRGVISLPGTQLGYFGNSLSWASEILLGTDDTELENKGLWFAKLFSKQPFKRICLQVQQNLNLIAVLFSPENGIWVFSLSY